MSLERLLYAVRNVQLRPLDGGTVERLVVQGQWKDGYQSGLGMLKFPDGRKYIGEFVDGLQHGIGAYVISNDESFVSIWKKGTTKTKDRLNILTVLLSL